MVAGYDGWLLFAWTSANAKFLHSRYKSRLPSRINSEILCNCGRAKEISDNTCMVCVDARVIVECPEKEKLVLEVVVMLKPVLCSKTSLSHTTAVQFSQCHGVHHVCMQLPLKVLKKFPLSLIPFQPLLCTLSDDWW